MSYNLTAIFNTGKVEDMMCMTNIQSGGLIGICIVLFVLILTISLLMWINYTIYTSLVGGLFISSLISSLLLFWKCSGGTMLKPEIVGVMWVLLAVAAFIRTKIEDR